MHGTTPGDVNEGAKGRRAGFLPRRASRGRRDGKEHPTIRAATPNEFDARGGRLGSEKPSADPGPDMRLAALDGDGGLGADARSPSASFM
jgi:hypothetical protein